MLSLNLIGEDSTPTIQTPVASSGFSWGGLVNTVIGGASSFLTSSNNLAIAEANTQALIAKYEAEKNIKLTEIQKQQIAAQTQAQQTAQNQQTVKTIVYGFLGLGVIWALVSIFKRN